MQELATAAKADEAFPDILFVHRASVEAATRYFEQRFPGAHTVADPEGVLYAAFALPRGSWWQVLGPKIWWRGLVAMLRGHVASKPTGHVLQMPGAFLVRAGNVLWQHRARHSADHPHLDQMLAVAGQPG